MSETRSDVPANAAEHCPGTQSEDAGKAGPCAGCPNQSLCASGALKQVDPDLVDIADRMQHIKHKMLVMSGKGGVGKSTTACILARALAARDPKCQVAVLDIDICGPSQPRLFAVEGHQVHQSASGWSPVYVEDNLCLMSVAFLLSNRNDAVIWRGPRKNALIKQFLKDVDWGHLDYLIIDKLFYLNADTPPGTSDEHISVVQYLLGAGQVDGALLVTTPQEISLLDVRKEANFCTKTKLPILGVIENMRSFVCPCCDKESDVFPATTGGGRQMAEDLQLDFLGSLPMDPRIGTCADKGTDFLHLHSDTPAATKYKELAERIAKTCQV